MGLDIYFETRKNNRSELDAKTAIFKYEINELEKKIDVLYGKADACGELPIDEKTKVDLYFKEIDNRKEKINEIDPYNKVAYFRKVNFLMSFFDYEGNCEYVPIDKNQVIDLIDTCKQVLENYNRANELLPTQCGFFFGSTDYDEFYFSDVKDVLDKFTEILDTTDWDNDELVMYAWW